MSRLQGYRVQVGDAFQFGDGRERLEEIVSEIIKEAELNAQEIVNKGNAQAAKVLQAAKQKAQQIIEAAEQQQEEYLEKGFRAGEKQGFEKGYAQATEDTMQLLQGANTIVESAFQGEKLVLKQFKQDAAQIVSQMVHKILHQNIQMNPNLLIDMIDGAVEELNLTGKIKVVISTNTLERLRQFNSQTKEALDQLKRFEFIADPNLGIHEVFVLGTEASYCLSIEKQVELLLNPIVKDLPIEAPLSIDPGEMSSQADCIGVVSDPPNEEA